MVLVAAFLSRSSVFPSLPLKPLAIRSSIIWIMSTGTGVRCDYENDTIKRCTPCEHPYTKKERQNLIQRSLHFHFLKSHDAITYMYK